jgi:hypothetical protein
MTITARQYQSLQSEACRLAEELPKTQLLDSLIAACEAGCLRSRRPASQAGCST